MSGHRRDVGLDGGRGVGSADHVAGVPFDTIAETVGRPAGTCRQLARRARAKFRLTDPKPGDVPPAEHQRVTEKFITACANGDLAGLAAVLDPAVWGVGALLADPAPPPQITTDPTTWRSTCCVTWGRT